MKKRRVRRVAKRATGIRQRKTGFSLVASSVREETRKVGKTLAKKEFRLPPFDVVSQRVF